MITIKDNSSMGVIWITGLSGSGKTTLALEIIKLSNKYKWVHLDGDDLREILSKGKLYDRESRISLARQYSNLANLISKQNHNVIVSTISLFDVIHKHNRQTIHNYFEVYLKSDIRKLKSRDVKKIYNGSNGKNPIMGISIEYDIPSNPNFVIHQDFIPSNLEIHAKAILKQIKWLNEHA